MTSSASRSISIASRWLKCRRTASQVVSLLLNGQYGKMVANHPPDIVPIPLGEVVGKTKTVPLDYDLLLTALPPAKKMSACA